MTTHSKVQETVVAAIVKTETKKEDKLNNNQYKEENAYFRVMENRRAEKYVADKVSQFENMEEMHYYDEFDDDDDIVITSACVLDYDYKDKEK